VQDVIFSDMLKSASACCYFPLYNGQGSRLDPISAISLLKNEPFTVYY